MEIVVFVVIVILIGCVVASLNQQGAHNAIRAALPEYSATQSYEPAIWESTSGISIDERRMKICLIDHTAVNPYRVISYADVLESEVVEDGYSVTKTGRGSQIVRGAIGAAVLGPVGLVVGALSGKKTTKDKISNVDLRVIVKDTVRPIHTIKFLKEETPKGSFAYKTANENAQRWQAILSIVISERK